MNGRFSDLARLVWERKSTGFKILRKILSPAQRSTDAQAPSPESSAELVEAAQQWNERQVGNVHSLRRRLKVAPAESSARTGARRTGHRRTASGE